MNSILSAIMIFDMLLKFFKAFKANQTELVNEDHDNDEKEDIKAKAKHQAYVAKRLQEESSRLTTEKQRARFEM